LTAPDGTVGYDQSGLVLLVPFPGWVTALVVVAALACIVLAVHNLRDASRRGLLLALRTGAVALAVWLYLQPALQFETVTRVRNHLALLVDGSRSMGLPAARAGATRAARVAAVLDEARPDLEALAVDHVIDAFRFAAGPDAASTAALTASPVADGDSTRLVESLEAVAERLSGQDMAALVVLSDGADNGVLASVPAGGRLPADVAERLQALGAPVHTVATGDTDAFIDVAVRHVAAQSYAFVQTPVRFEATVRGVGLGGRAVRVTLEQGGHPVQTRTLPLESSGAVEVGFDVTPDRVGRFVYAVVVEAVPGEAVLENNRREVVVRVIRDKLRVLQVAGRPSWDERFLRKVLKRNANVDLISFFILRTGASQQRAPNHELSLIPFPTRELFEEQLDRFDAVILQDFDYRPYQMRQHLPRIAGFVERGGALLMTGGSQSFSAGGYHGTRVAGLLPVEIGPQALVDSAVSTDPFPPRLTEAGRRHPVTRLSPDPVENERIWRTLPPLEGVNLVRGLRPGAVTLVEHPFLTLPDGSNHPVVVAGEAGKGRVLAVLTDSGWRWALPAAARGGDPRHHQRFWNNALRWLLKDPEWKRIEVQTAEDSYLPGETVGVQVTVVNRSYEPAADASVSLSLQPAGGASGDEKPLASGKSDSEGRFVVEVPAPGPGAWAVVGKVLDGGEVEEDSAVFLVRGTHPELEDAAVREDLLEAIANATGGTFTRLDDLGLADLERRPPRVVRVDRRRTIDLWNTPWGLLLAVILLGAEWWLRRRQGLL